MTQKSLILASLATAALAWGCAEPPTEQLALSHAALDEARTVEAEEWAEGEWKDAQAAVAAAEAEIAAQAEKMALTRKYDTAIQLLQTAEQKADAAQAAAVANKESARQSALASLEAVRTALGSARDLSVQLAGCPSKPKGFEADLTVVSGNLEALEAQLAPIQGLFDSEGFAAVDEEAAMLGEQVNTLATDMTSVMSKIGCTPAPVATPVA